MSRTSPQVTLLTMCAGLFFVLLDVTIVNVALPSIGTGLDAGIAGLQWVIDAYQITLAALLLTGGTLGDRYGHRRVVVAGLSLFALGSLGCALAPGVSYLIAARVLQGVGAALLLPGSLAVITRTFTTPAERARAIGVWAAVGGFALPAGPVLGGMLVQWLGWRSVFAINVPVAALVLIAITRFVQETEPLPRRLDIPGVALGAGTLAAATYTVIEGVHLPTALLTVALATAFILVERRRTSPVLPLSLFRRRPIALGTLAALVMNLGINGMLLLFTLYFQQVQHRSPIASGAALLPMFLPMVALSAPAGRLAGKYGPRPVMVSGLAFLTVGLLLLLPLESGSPYTTMLPPLFIIGLGASFLTPSVVTLAMSAAPSGREGLASAINNTARQAGGAIGVALCGALAAHGLVKGIHHAALMAALAYVLVAALTLTIRPTPTNA
ncbi:MFS transporter [Spirillospora sp. NPDC048911]|uniref:MFS transporter n=1 Tax=Spirillospora sp. NPDC048911 TaxID=3364527 RepID=UPI0037164B31